MVRGRAGKNAVRAEGETAGGLDVNAVVSYNLKWIREREGWTQQGVAQRLAQLTGHELPQASISAMERGVDGDRRRRFDAHELYLFSVVFDVPIAFFFVPPPSLAGVEIADTQVPVANLYAAFLGRPEQLPYMDERLTELGLKNPDEVDEAVAIVMGADYHLGNWHEHYRTWRKKRLLALAQQYGDRLDEVADVLGEFVNSIKALGPRTYLQMVAHKSGEDVLPMTADPEQVTMGPRGRPARDGVQPEPGDSAGV
jgi:transcriptional regulator with XRE-family HTH domain